MPAHTFASQAILGMLSTTGWLDLNGISGIRRAYAGFLLAGIPVVQAPYQGPATNKYSVCTFRPASGSGV